MWENSKKKDFSKFDKKYIWLKFFLNKFLTKKTNK